MKRIVPSTVFVAALAAGVVMTGCGSMGGSQAQTTAMPEISDKTVCEIQQKWNSMSYDQQAAALNYQLRELRGKYNAEDIEALRYRVRTTRC